MLDNARRRVEARDQLGRIVEEARVVGDHVSVGRRLDGAQLDASEPAKRRFDPKRQQLEWHGRPEALDTLVRGRDDNEALRSSRHDLLACVRRAATLDHPAIGSDLIGTVDCHVELAQRIERLDGEPQLLGCTRRARRRGDAGEGQSSPGERRQEVGHGRAGAETEAHSIRDEVGRRLRHEQLLVVVGVPGRQLESERYSAGVAVTRALVESRWSRLRSEMDTAGLDGLLLAGRGILASYGYVVYAAGYTPLLRHSYVYLDAETEPVLWVPSAGDAANVRERGLIADVRATGDGDWAGASVPMPDAVAAELAARGPARLGVAGFGAIIPPAHEEILRRSLTSLEIVDATATVLAAKERKDEAELVGVRAATRLARAAYDAAPELLAVGARAQRVVSQLEQILRQDGALELLVFVDRGPYVVRRVTDTVFERGDLVSVLVEVADADGYWVEIGGLFSLGEPSEKGAQLAAACYEALDAVVDTCRPGRAVRDGAACLDEVARSRSLATGVALAHGVGIDHDLPTVTHDSNETFTTGHVVSIHPNLIDEDAGLGAVVADGAIVGMSDHAPERISGLESELTVLEERSNG